MSGPPQKQTAARKRNKSLNKLDLELRFPT